MHHSFCKKWRRLSQFLVPFFFSASLFVSLMLSGCNHRQEQLTDLPWQIEQDEHQRITVFGVTLGETTLQSIEEKWQAESSVALFSKNSKSATGLMLEAYFERLTLGAFQVRVVVLLQADQNWLRSIQQRSSRPKPGPSGDYRYQLSESDLNAAKGLKITELTYIPSYPVESETLTERFDNPDKIKTVNESTQYWFYADKGLVITINQPGRDLFHYTNPAEFSSAVARLSGG